MNFVSAYINLSYVNKDGKSPIYIRIRIEGKYLKSSTELFLKPSEWDEKKQRVRVVVKKAEEWNMIIEQKKSLANSIFIKYKLANIPLTNELFQAEFKNPTSNIDFYTFVQSEIDARKKRLASGSLRHENSFLNIMKSFKADLSFSELTEDFVYRFYENLCDKKNGIPYRNKIIQKLNFYVKIAIQRNYLKNNPIKIAPKKFKKLPVFLEESEVKELIRIYKSETLPYSFQKVLRWYLFTCLAGGMRISDLKKITFEHIVSKRYLILAPKKNENVDGRSLRIELPEPALKLIKDEGKFTGTIFNMYKTDQITNRVIKKVFAVAGIKRKKISWHSSRHTFAVMYLTKANNAMAFPTLSKILGHATVKQTMDTYVGITTLMLDEGMRNMNSFEI